MLVGGNNEKFMEWASRDRWDKKTLNFSIDLINDFTHENPKDVTPE